MLFEMLQKKKTRFDASNRYLLVEKDWKIETLQPHIDYMKDKPLNSIDFFFVYL